MSNSENTFFVSPKTPDAEGDVGPNDYVQWVNLKFKIWSKNGELRYGPASGNTLWSGLGGPCQEYNWGDPQVVFDRIANRWVFMQYAFPTNFTEPIAPFYLCIAVSKTSDPTGQYNRYAFRVNASTDYFPDYPKLGVWPDGYYVTTNNYSNHVPQGAAVYAFDRSKMLEGDPSASFIEYQQSSAYKYLLPANFTGSTLPPQGAPEYFGALEPVHCGISCNTMFGGTVRLWRFHANFAVPSESSFTGPTNLPVSPYHSLCMMSGCIPQPGTTQEVDAGSDHLLQRLDYRNFGDHESLVVTHTVDAGNGVAGMRWYEIQASPPGGAPSVKEESTYAPADGINRWMGSTAMDGAGNIALGYSMANGTSEYPSVGYTGASAGSPEMNLGETTLVHGGGSETGTDRWGDYSAMSIDPIDEQTFWYTQGYYATTSGLGWTTRIGSFRLMQGLSATLTQVNGGLVVFPYVTKRSVASVAGGCTPGKGTVDWLVSGPQNDSGSVACSSSGTWTASLTAALTTDGTYTVSAAQSTASSPSQTLTLDTTAPDAPTLTALPEYIKNGQSLTATSVSDNPGGSGVKRVNYLYCPGESCTPSTLIGSSSTAAGNYAVTWTGQPTDGKYRVVAQTEDEAGNTANSSSQSTAIDNTRPAVSLTELNGAAVTFPYATTQSVTTMGGSCEIAPGDSAGVSWAVSPTSSEVIVSDSAACSEGGWNATVSIPAEGSYLLSVTQEDKAGNVGSSGNLPLTIDRTDPATPTLTPLPAYIRNGRSLTATNVSDAGAGVKRVNYLSCAGEGCTPNTLIGSSSTATGNYPVTWSGQPADGTYEVMAQTEDKAGNTANSAIQPTTIDNTPPVVSLTEVNGSSVTFPYATNRNVTSIGGQCTFGDGTVSWSISGAASQSGTVPCPGGTWTASLSSPLSTYGGYLLSATQSDLAGNTSSSGGRSLILGDLPPIASFTFLPTLPRVSQAVLFRGEASSDPDGAISSYAWRFGDGAGANGVTASHGYSKTGPFTVQLSVTDDSGGVGVAAKSLSVSSARRPGPAVRLQIPPQRLPVVLRRGLCLRIASNERAGAKLRLVLSSRAARALGLAAPRRSLTIASRSVHVPAGKTVALSLPISQPAAHHLRLARAATVTLKAVVTGTTGKTSIDRRLLLRR